MPVIWFQQKTPTLFHRKNIFMVWIGVLFFALTLNGCLGAKGEKTQSVTGFVQTEDGSPVNGATVRIQATSIQTTSDENGLFSLSIPPSEEQITLTAWALGYFNGGPVLVEPGDKEIEIELLTHPSIDNSNYQWLSTYNDPGQGEDQACAACHSNEDHDNSLSLPVDEWMLDAHSRSAVNPRFITMYLGNDTQGNQSPATEYVSKKDYGTEPIKPDSTKPYYGPGYKLDFPDTAGNCSTCHAPIASISDPYNTDPTKLDGVAAEGINCDFCHKIWGVILDQKTGLPHQNMPGVLSYQFRRPPDRHQFFAGPFDDVAPGEDTFSVFQTQSQICAPCHFGVFWDTVVYDSFGEWLHSPYSDPETGQTCQDCHMPRLGMDHFALPEKGGLTRDPATIFSHQMPGASDEVLLQNAVSMTVTASTDGDNLQVQVTLTNDKAGHHVPTDSPLRHLILLVTAEDENGQRFLQTSGPYLPDWCGVGDRDYGYYAGLPGQVYAKVLAEQWTHTSPTAAYWNPTYLVHDNRLAAFSSDTTNFTFAIAQQKEIQIQVRLLYRRAFIKLMDQKGWQTPDLLMEEAILRIEQQ